MPPVGRPRSRTADGQPAPVNEVGVAYTGYGTAVQTFSLLTGKPATWGAFVDDAEYVPELRWPMSVPVYDQMRSDSQLSALLTALNYGIAQLRFVIDPNGARPSLVQEISEDLNVPVMGEEHSPRRRMKRRFAHNKHLAQAFLAPIYGHMYFEQKVEYVNGKFRLRKLAPRMPHTIRSINVAEDGGLVSIQQYASAINAGLNDTIFGGPPIGVNRLTAFIFQQEGYNWVGRSLLRDCYKDWLIKDRLLRVDAINHERAGGVPYAEAAPGMTAGEIKELAEMMQAFKIGDTSGGAVPFGADVKIAKGTGSDVDKSIRSRDESMARRFLLMLANLAQGGQHVGSYALGDVFNDVFWVSAQRACVQWYCDVMNEHVIEDLCDWNYGEDEELCPVLRWEGDDDVLGMDVLAKLVQEKIILVDDELEDWVRYRGRLPARSAPREQLQKKQQELEAPPAVGPGLEGAPSPSAPAAQASLFEQERPHVMASQAPALVTIANVPVLEVGVEYQLSTGPATFTPEDLRDAVTAANEDRSIPAPRYKIGHIDPRFNDAKTFDGTPSFGSYRNFRLSENGMIAYADLVGVPKWLADIAPTAYPSRSIEGFWGVESQMGKTWSFVLSAVAALGVQWPGVTQLEDLPQWYTDETPDEAVIDWAAVAAARGEEKGMRLVAAAANLDDVRRAFYNNYVEEHRADGAFMWWVRAVMTDPNQLVVEDDMDGQLYLLDFSSDDKGNVSFGEAKSVRIDYVPDESKKAAATHVAAALAEGRKVLASWSSRAESCSEVNATQGGSRMNIRERLGLPADASDEQVQQALAEINQAASQEVGGIDKSGAGDPQTRLGLPMEQHPGTGDRGNDFVTPPVPVTDTGGGQPSQDPDKAGSMSGGGGSHASGAPASQLSIPDGTRLVDEEAWNQVTAQAKAGFDMAARQHKDHIVGLVAACAAEGRIPVARQDHWVALLEQDFEGGKAALASMAPGTIPVQEIGHGGNAGNGGGDGVVVEAYPKHLFPELLAREEQEKAIASGTIARPRIASDKGGM